MNNRDFVSKREMQGQVSEDALCLPHIRHGVHTCTHHPHSWLQVCVFTDSTSLELWQGLHCLCRLPWLVWAFNCVCVLAYPNLLTCESSMWSFYFFTVTRLGCASRPTFFFLVCSVAAQLTDSLCCCSLSWNASSCGPEFIILSLSDSLVY